MARFLQLTKIKASMVHTETKSQKAYLLLAILPHGGLPGCTLSHFPAIPEEWGNAHQYQRSTVVSLNHGEKHILRN